jgi:putative ABC transport system substrate-binding protein
MFLYSPVFYPVRESIAQQAVENGLPLIGDTSDTARAGFFMSYGTDAPKTFKRLAYFIDRVVKGARPNDLPVEQPSELELVVNLKTAKALNLMVPQSILLRANEAIR